MLSTSMHMTSLLPLPRQVFDSHINITIMSYTLGHFTFWITLSLSISLSPKFGLRPKISQKVKSFFLFGLSDSLSA